MRSLAVSKAKSTSNKHLHKTDQDQNDHRRNIEHANGWDQSLSRDHDRIGHAFYKAK